MNIRLKPILPKAEVANFSKMHAEYRRREQLHYSQTLLGFVETFWHVLEPVTPFVSGWPIEAMCDHLEAVTRGKITRLLINISPGSMKSLLCNVMWPAWEWSLGGKHSARRTINFSYAAHLTHRDNAKFRDIVSSPLYQKLFKDKFKLTKEGEVQVGNDKTGWKLASSVGGVTTGARADRVTFDDPHNVKQAESDLVRKSTVDWFRTSMSSRLNNMEKSAIVVIMQRVHFEDVSGYIINNLEALGYVHLCIPAEFDPGRKCITYVGGKKFWEDPRRLPGELFWPERFPTRVLTRQKLELGPFAYSGQYMQSPVSKGGEILKREWWQLWDDDVAARNDFRRGHYPPFVYICASIDTAYTEKTENDPSACTVWGVWNDINGNAKVMLINAWAERLEIHPLVRKIAETCKTFRVSRILIESKASGISVAQELRRRANVVGEKMAQHQDPKLAGHGNFTVSLVNPGKQDKVSRAYAIQHLFSAGIVYAPDKAWADMVITECEQFPKSAHDDLTDTVTQALAHLRAIGFALLPDESKLEADEAARYRSPEVALYPV